MSGPPPPPPKDFQSSLNISRKRKRRRNNKNKGDTGHDASEPDLKEQQRTNKKIVFLDLREEGSEPQLNEIELKTLANGEYKVQENSVPKVEDDENVNGKKDLESPLGEELESTKGKKMKKPKVVFFNHSENLVGDDDDDDGSYHKPTHYGKSQLMQRAQELLEVRKSLPVFQHKEKILEFVGKNQVTVILGETGSGKSTQIPQFLIPKNKRLAVSQPRRVAAASLAARVSEEFGCTLGQEVGYQVRFSNFTHLQKTKLKYLTDGMLLREVMLDPLLKQYTTIIIDEAHERTILTDLILGFLKELLDSKKRPDLRVIVMSATLNAELFSKFFDHAPILYVEGRMYPVSKLYLEDDNEDIVNTMMRAIVQVNLTEPSGDILCFLPGQEEIDNCVSSLEQIAPKLPKEAPLIAPLPLYAALSPAQQARIFEVLPKNRRKVILATNIAETSITVSGVKYVIDSGLRKVKVWKHQLGLSTLLTTPISQASAKQRAGRAGRETSGKAFRLYLESVYTNHLPKQQEPEIVRNDIILPILTLKKIGVDDLINWSWIEHPGRESILSALNTLYSLGALDNNGKITATGRKMAVLPLLPQLSVSLLEAIERDVIAPVIDIAACLSVENLVLNVSDRNGVQRDEVNFKRRQYCPLGLQHGDLIALLEYLTHFKGLLEKRGPRDAKAWCNELHMSYKGFRNVLRVRSQLRDYIFAAIKQDDSFSPNERSSSLRKLQILLDEAKEDEEIKKSLDIQSVLKSFLKGYITNTAIGMPDRSYRTLTTGQLISIHPSSNLFGKANLDVMYMEFVFTSKAYGRICSAIDSSWLQEIAPHILGTTRINANED